MELARTHLLNPSAVEEGDRHHFLFPIQLHSTTFLHKCPEMHYVKHKIVKNTLPSHHVKHDDTRVPPNCRRAETQGVSRHPGWLDLSLKRVL
jgi:hypothetical protein